jgi:hypothetical protein
MAKPRCAPRGIRRMVVRLSGRVTTRSTAGHAHLVIDMGRPIAVVAREIGVGEQLLGRWVGIERSRLVDPPAALDVDERAELPKANVTESRLLPLDPSS